VEVVVSVSLSRRAIRDLEQIEEYSTHRWGGRVAGDYLSSIESALTRLGQKPELLRERPQISEHFKFYWVGQHFLVCIQIRSRIYVLTIKHASMDLPQRISELEPQLLLEAKLLHAHCLSSKRR
jgi:toxin ParE1/3/4